MAIFSHSVASLNFHKVANSPKKKQICVVRNDPCLYAFPCGTHCPLQRANGERFFFCFPYVTVFRMWHCLCVTWSCLSLLGHISFSADDIDLESWVTKNIKLKVRLVLGLLIAFSTVLLMLTIPVLALCQYLLYVNSSCPQVVSRSFADSCVSNSTATGFTDVNSEGGVGTPCFSF